AANATTVTFGCSAANITLPNNIGLVPAGSGSIDFLVSTNNSLTLNGTIVGISDLIKGLGGGGGTLALANASNSFSGKVVILAGTLSIASNGALGNVNDDIAIGGGTLANSVLQATADVTLAVTRDISLNSVNIGSCMINVATLSTLSIPGIIS